MAAADAPEVRVHAVEDTSVQLTWRGLPSATGLLGIGPAAVEIRGGPPAWAHTGSRTRRLCPLPYGPGAATVEGLSPGTRYPLWWEPPAGRRTSLGTVTTLGAPPGALLARFATVSDLHIGERRFGLWRRYHDVHPRVGEPAAYPVRAAAGALAEAAAWGAGTLVVKGDMTDRGTPAQLRAVADLVAATAMTPLVQLGNHDRRSRLDPAAQFPGAAVAARGVPVVHDLPGVRLVLADTPSRRDRWGHLDPVQIERLAAAAAGAAGAVVVSLHHPPERLPLPTSYPPGLVHTDSRRLLAALRAANPATLLIAGHTHRNRTYRAGGVLVAEVGSTKDYPGGWAGYAVHEGGIRQVVRRTEAPDVLRWTEATRSALGGAWGRWSPGRIGDRCWSHTWPRR